VRGPRPGPSLSATHRDLSVARELGRELEFEVDVLVVGDVVHDLDDLAVHEAVAPAVFPADGVAAVLADAEVLAPDGGVADLLAERPLVGDFVVDVERHGAETLVVLADLLLDELNAESCWVACARKTCKAATTRRSSTSWSRSHDGPSKRAGPGLARTHAKKRVPAMIVTTNKGRLMGTVTQAALGRLLSSSP
jgi:hypothetical protein